MNNRPRLDDPAWLDAQYDNRKRVADSAASLERWASASAAARAGSPAAKLDLRYGDGRNETLDIFPAAQPNAPVLVYIHGGYWRALDKSDFSFVAPAFAAEGATVVVPNYALCPAVGIDDIALQTARAVAWVWRRIGEFGGDRSRIALVGHSAGGHLVAMLVSCRWKQLGDDLPAAPVTGGLAISGLYDLEPLRHVPFLKGDLRITPQTVARASPAFFPRPKAAPLYATVGVEESDEFLRHNQLIRDVWGPTAVPVCETVPGNHFSVLEGLVSSRGRLHELALRLLNLR